ncbi:MAG: YHS domain-containing protein [Nitrospirota bacterium]
MAKDPVCNMQVDEKKAAATSVYKGATYHFCAKICKEKFDKDPEKYMTKEQK